MLMSMWNSSSMGTQARAEQLLGWPAAIMVK